MQQAAENLKSGGLVAFPTETVYGLGANAEDENAIQRMYKVKNRPVDHPVIVHIADLDAVDYWATDIPDYAIALMRDYWPGPMTLLLKRTEKAKDFVTGNQEIVGLRIPAHTLAINLLQEFSKIGGKGVAAPSANRYGAVSPTTAQAVDLELQEYLEPRDQILDGGQSLVGVESTIIDCTRENPAILRPGAITAEMVEQSTGIIVIEPEGTKVKVSGSHKQHYSPNAKVIIGAETKPGNGLIAMADLATPEGVIRLAAPKTLEEYARILYSALREADAQKLAEINVVMPEGNGLAVAIRDRITRAAAL
ncbi:MAG: threonylcarbamoyl-AMP synthase [Candidatus Nanopelagicaceae bacterium]|nr:threonylcarbamoyl-AMP synthase [Candidatus Nanopelagicaceae bacterium]